MLCGPRTRLPRELRVGSHCLATSSPTHLDLRRGGVARYPPARPVRTAQAATSVRDAMPSLDSTFETWTAAVRGEM
jgi:hypothetical protein